MLSSIKHRDLLHKFLTSDDTFATVLAAILFDNYGMDFLSWDQDTLDREINEDFGIQLSQINRDKIQAYITCITTELFHKDWFVFNNICEAFNNDPIDFETLDPVPPEYMAWAITEVGFMSDDKQEFDDEVKTYIGTLLDIDGVHRVPDVLRIAKLPKSATPDTNEMDPVMYQGYYNKQMSDAGIIQDYVVARTKMLLEQMNTVPIENRDSESWNKFYAKVTKSLGQSAQRSDT